MAVSTRITENGDTRIGESVAGLTLASSLNDARITLITKETFTTDPLLRGWLIGANWSWSSVNGNMAAI